MKIDAENSRESINIAVSIARISKKHYGVDLISEPSLEKLLIRKMYDDAIKFYILHLDEIEEQEKKDM